MESFEFRTKEASASKVVSDCMTEFTVDVAAQKVANIVDGLKSIHRRILWAMGPNEKWLSLHTFVGKVIEIHPVGDKSINEACVRCMQQHSIGLQLLKGKGNVGGYDSEDAGADRYLKVMISPIAKDLFFEGVNLKTLPTKETEDFMSEEPVHFIPRLPTALLLYSLTLGVGFKSEIFPMNLDNVCVLVQKYLEHKAKYPNLDMEYSKLSHLFIPDFPIRNTIRNVEDLLSSYDKGKFAPQVVVDGVVDVYPNMVVIKTAPFGTSFEGIEVRLRTMLQDKKSWIYDLRIGFGNAVSDSTEGALAITFKRGVDTFDVAYRLIKELGLSKGVRPIPKFVNRHGKLYEMTPPKLIAIWHQVRKESIYGGIKSDQIQNMRQTLERKTKLLVHDRWDEVDKIVRNGQMTIPMIMDTLMTHFNLSYNQAKILANSPIITAHKQSSESLQDEIDALEKKAIILKDNLSRVDDLIYRDTEYFLKKYHQPRRTKITLYMGYVSVSDKHIIQFDTFEEGQALLDRFPGSKIYFYQDPKKMPMQYFVLNGAMVKPKVRLPKMFAGSQVIEAPDGGIYSLCLVDNTASIVDGIHAHKSTDDTLLIPVSKNFLGIHPDGTIDNMSIKDLTHRKGVGKRGGKSDLIYAIPSGLGDIVLVHMSTIDPTIMYLNLIVPGETKKVPMSVLGKTEFLGIVSTKVKNPVMLNLPSWANGNFKYATINDIVSVMKGGSNMSISINRKMSRDSVLRSSFLI